MKLEGQRITIPKWIHADRCVLRVTVEAVLPADDPTEPCLEPHTLRWLDHLQQLANAGDLDELQKHGDLYVRRSA